MRKKGMILSTLQSEISINRHFRKSQMICKEKNRSLYQSDFGWFGITSMGKKNIHRFFLMMEEKGIRPDYIVSTGFAGALDEAMRPGDIAAARSVLSDGIEEQALNYSRVKELQKALKAKCFLTHTIGIDRIADYKEKIRLKKIFPDAGFVDMESHWLAMLCRERSIPLTVIRSVSDAFQDRLPPLDLIEDRKEKILTFSYLAKLLRNLNEVPNLLRFLVNLNKARKSINRIINILAET